MASGIADSGSLAEARFVEINWILLMSVSLRPVNLFQINTDVQEVYPRFELRLHTGGYIGGSLDRSRRTLALWEYDYNDVKPHSLLRNQSPVYSLQSLA